MLLFYGVSLAAAIKLNFVLEYFRGSKPLPGRAIRVLIPPGETPGSSAPEKAGRQNGESPFLCGEESCGIEP
jgi:hypothetical protein